MISIERLKCVLSDMNLSKVAQGANVHPNVLYRLMKGETDPAYSTVKKIIDYLVKKGVLENVGSRKIL